LWKNPDAPACVEQWLGYFLLFVPDREDDAIRHSEAYRSRFPDANDALLNMACGYAQRYCSHRSTQPQSEDRQKAVATLEQALTAKPEYLDLVKTWTKPGESFDCFKDDRDFQALLARRSASSPETEKQTTTEEQKMIT